MDDLTCNCCDQPKEKLTMKKSALLKGHTLYLCQTCIDGKKEPRWIVILTGHEYGIATIKDYLTKGRYCGRTIEGSELV